MRKVFFSILYEDDIFMIGTDGLDEHGLLVNDIYVPLDRGILRDLARSNVTRLETSPVPRDSALVEMADKNIPLAELGWAFAKAVMQDQEDYANYLASGG